MFVHTILLFDLMLCVRWCTGTTSMRSGEIFESRDSLHGGNEEMGGTSLMYQKKRKNPTQRETIVVTVKP